MTASVSVSPAPRRKSIDCWRVQRSAWRPVSTTSRAARQAWPARKTLRVEAPALDIGTADETRSHPPEAVEGGVLDLEGDLEVVPGRRLVVRGRRKLRERPRIEVVGVHVVRPRAAAVLRR